MVISHNVSALNTYKSLGIAGNAMDSSMEKLSSGYKINKAADDAAGLSISEKMRSQIRGLNQASTNAENGVSMIQTAEGALNETHSILQRMRELAVQAATDTNADEDRESLQSEMEQLTNEINRIGNSTEFNGMKVLNGDKANVEAVKSTAEVGIFKATYDEGGVKGNKKVNIGVTLDTGTAETGVTVGTDGKVTITVSKADGDILNATSGKTVKEKQAVIDKINTKLVAGKAGFTLEAKDDLAEDESAGLASVTAGDITFAGGVDEIEQSVYFHVGANSDQVINTEFKDMRAEALGISWGATKYAELTDEEKENLTSSVTVNDGSSTEAEEYALNISTREGANNAISVIDDAIKAVSQERSRYGSIQNRLEYTMNNLNTTAENMTAAESTIRDVDMAEEMMEYTKNSILQQAAQAMLVQANARPQQALQLLQ